MLMKSHDDGLPVVRRTGSGPEVVTLPVGSAAANAERWAGSTVQARRLRRQRRMARAAYRPVAGWIVRIW